MSVSYQNATFWFLQKSQIIASTIGIRLLFYVIAVKVIKLIPPETYVEQEPYGHLTSASVIIDRFNMVSVGYPHKDMPLLQPISFILNGS